MASFVTKLFIGSLLITSGAFAARDVCEGPNRHICEGNLNVPRHLMPQVQGDAQRAFLRQMADEGHHIEQVEIDPIRMAPAQREINQDIIDGMEEREGYDSCKTEPILVEWYNKTLRVIDGHHRWAACRLKAQKLERSLKQVAIIIYNTGVSILERLRNFPGVFNLNINEHQN